ncbi:GNAT family N-acetyltransferase [Pedobacter agri]|uniref:GNAT family N-acetyltransferase n=1 Tax=Pedobacter agri TaxID=454586 RepID=UPI0027879CEB|nr:GNAT family N-acetyltransferase [Pedobacter agri]MDQ1142084.1 ribosomal protein S18 acetylase RimI-like enzyme [Pedobacter agri]
MNAIKISIATSTDFKIIQEIGRETFYETFASGNTEEVMQQYLQTSFSAEKVKTELNHPNSLFFIAWDHQIPIGYLKVNMNDAQTELQESDSLEIERIYVKAHYHGKKVGQLLYDQAVEIAMKKMKKSIWLGVWEENPKAIRFYEKNGFVPFSRHIFKMGDEEQTDIMMRKIIA